MGLFDIFKKKKPKSILDAVNENPEFQRLKKVYEMMSPMCADGCDTDEIPGAVGEFGLTPTNPIPTNTIIGSVSYLRKLVTADGHPVRNERLGTTTIECINQKPVDEYRLTDASGRELALIYISPYNKKNSKKAPKGFKLMFV